MSGKTTTLYTPSIVSSHAAGDALSFKTAYSRPDRLKPTDKQLSAARLGKVLAGDKFAVIKKAGRTLWSSKGGLISGLVVGGGAVAAGLLHSQWLPGLIHLATTPVGMGVLAGLGGLALLAGGLYMGRQLTTSVKNARANNAHAAVKQEKAAEKQAKVDSKRAPGLAMLSQKTAPVAAAEVQAPVVSVAQEPVASPAQAKQAAKAEAPQQVVSAFATVQQAPKPAEQELSASRASSVENFNEAMETQDSIASNWSLGEAARKYTREAILGR